MTKSSDNNDMFRSVKEGLLGVGYQEALLLEHYQFADVLANEYSVQEVDLAAFAQDPPSYRSACIGVVFGNELNGTTAVTRCRSLGAPQVFEVREHHLLRWAMTERGEPRLLDSVEAGQIPGLFRRYQHDWSPIRILGAKATRDSSSYQLDFFDAGLLPLREEEARAKLDRLLQGTVALAISEFEKSAPFQDGDYPPLFRLLFRFIAAKVLADRGHPGDWLHEDPQLAAMAVQDFYEEPSDVEVLSHRGAASVAWERIRHAFHFQNLSVESLAYVYETTLVAEKTRNLYGIHSTPPYVAEYIVRQMHFEDLEIQDSRVFEPFAGHAVFLVAAMQRLKERLPLNWTRDERHEYFRRMLVGIEIDDFAREVARLSLMLADYPNPAGWRIYGADALTSELVETELERARVVLCNPPFENFNLAERAQYGQLFSVSKPAAILHRVLQRPPQMLGFVLPRSFVDGRRYRDLRLEVARIYTDIDLVALPDKVFRHSDVEAVLLVAAQRPGKKRMLSVGEVKKQDLQHFYHTHQPSYVSSTSFDPAKNDFGASIWIPALSDVWEAATHLKTLGDVAAVHRGIEFNVRLDRNRDQLVSTVPRAGYVPGLQVVRDHVEPFLVTANVFLNISAQFMKGGAHLLPWEHPKIIVNARRRTRGPWTVSASVDTEGLVCYQNFHGVWPSDATHVELLAAVLNGPVANAFVATREGKRDVRRQTLLGIPVPNVEPGQVEVISEIVREYSRVRRQWLFGTVSRDEGMRECKALLHLIDAEVLKAYDFAPRTERGLLDHFSEYSRPGPADFREYFPRSFKPFVSWHEYQSGEVGDASADATLRRLPTIDDPAITEAMAHFYDTELEW